MSNFFNTNLGKIVIGLLLIAIGGLIPFVGWLVKILGLIVFVIGAYPYAQVVYTKWIHPYVIKLLGGGNNK